MKKMKLLTFTALLMFLAGNAQGLNNSQYEVDDKDFKNIASLFLNIDIYKFFVNANIDDTFIEVTLESYKNGVMNKKENLIANTIKKIGFNPLAQGSSDNFIRFYIKNELKKEKSISLVIKNLNFTLPIHKKNLNLQNFQTRAFSNIPNYIESKTAVLALYGNKNGLPISCSGNATPKDVIKLYDWVCIVSLRPLETN